MPPRGLARGGGGGGGPPRAAAGQGQAAEGIQQGGVSNPFHSGCALRQLGCTHLSRERGTIMVFTFFITARLLCLFTGVFLSAICHTLIAFQSPGLRVSLFSSLSSSVWCISAYQLSLHHIGPGPLILLHLKYSFGRSDHTALHVRSKRCTPTVVRLCEPKPICIARLVVNNPATPRTMWISCRAVRRRPLPLPAVCSCFRTQLAF